MPLMNDEDVIVLLERLHRDGYGITVNRWADDEDYVVMLRRVGVILGSGNAPSLYAALHRAELMALVSA